MSLPTMRHKNSLKTLVCLFITQFFGFPLLYNASLDPNTLYIWLQANKQFIKFTYRKLLIFQNHVMQYDASIHDYSYLVDMVLTSLLFYNSPTSLEDTKNSYEMLSCMFLSHFKQSMFFFSCHRKWFDKSYQLSVNPVS